MFSAPGMEMVDAPTVHYPEIPELGVREKLMMEKEAAGMYFSGSLLDEYSQHLALLQPQSISDFVGEDASPEERAYVKIAGMITSVTPKATKNGDRMAFFMVEDRLGEIECVAFARQFSEMSHLIRQDVGVYVCGNLSLREDEPPKLLLHRMETLVENSKFRREDFKKNETAQKREAPIKKAPTEARAAEAPKRLFLRVPDAKGREYLKAYNLAELFEGDFPAFFYFADEKRYETTPIGVYLSDYVLAQLRALLGDENVILK
jgi:DNA polymerase-3 subunit alpha